LAAPPWFPYPGCPVRHHKRPVLVVLSQPSCFVSHVLALLYWVPCSSYTVLVVLFLWSCSFSPVLMLSISGCPVLDVSFSLLPFLDVLFLLHWSSSHGISRNAAYEISAD
jgi:hypothetical protein